MVLTTPGHLGATYRLGGPRWSPRPTSRLPRGAGSAGSRRRRTPHPWLRAMFAYYDDFGLPTGPVPLAAAQPHAHRRGGRCWRELGWQELPALRPGIG